MSAPTPGAMSAPTPGASYPSYHQFHTAVEYGNSNVAEIPFKLLMELQNRLKPGCWIPPIATISIG
jgi:hypothetical protein